MGYSVGRVSDLAGVTVRTLHHYDEIGLLRPSSRNHAGHRRYSDDDLDRLQQILYYRALGFSLEEVAVLLDDPHVDPAEHLRRQHRLLTDRIEELTAMAAAVERAMEARMRGIQLTPEEKFEVFGDFDPEAHADEAERRWGDSEAYRESRRRIASYTKEDWQRINAEAAEINRRMVAVMESGAAPDSEAAMDLAEEHRQHISRYHYTCGYDIHTGLAELYVTDQRFTDSIDQAKPGLAAYLSEAILANAARHS